MLQDCEATILSCESGGCSCEDLVVVSEEEEEEWGVCQLATNNTTTAT
jgi:hypothetical protein